MAPNQFNVLVRRILACGLIALTVWRPAALAGDPIFSSPSFNGRVSLVLTDGGRLIGGSLRDFDPPGYSFALERMNSDGTPDTSFNGSGLATVPIWGYYEFVGALAVQPDGKIVAGGNAADPAGRDDPDCYPAFCRIYPALIRLNPDGSIDHSFNGNGRIIIAIGDLNSSLDVDSQGILTGFVLEPDGKITVHSGSTVAARLNADGTLDKSFAASWAPREVTNIDASVFEYYNASLDHYFMTWVPTEIGKLDARMVTKGWTRTGKTWKAYTKMQSGTSPVCRFYIPPAFGDSHFFGRGTDECNATAQINPSFVLEDPTFMHVLLPTAGVCPPDTTPIYRVFNNRADANHRYMTDKAVRDAMVAIGWIAEGDGPDRVVMCAPQ